MNIWTVITIDQDNGLLTTLHWSQEDADDSAINFCENLWQKLKLDKSIGAMPKTWRKAYNAIRKAGNGDTGELYCERHSFEPTPETLRIEGEEGDKRFTVTLTRDITESALIEVSALGPSEAEEVAMRFSEDSRLEWAPDDNHDRNDETYVSDTEEM